MWKFGLVHLLTGSLMDTAFHTSGCRACISVGACIVRRWKRKACRCKDSAFHWCLPSNVSTLVPPCLLQGFRRFTYYLDRPDVMSKFTSVRLEADESKCPILQLDCERTAVTMLGNYLVLSTMDMLLLCGFHSGCKSTLCDWVWSLASEFERSQESEAISFAATGLQVISFELFFVSL